MTRVRLYHFYNWEQSENGEPFALCDDCIKTQPVPEYCILNLLANEALWQCEKCGAKN